MAVNVKMGVDISSFTSGIREGQNILKGLNAELKNSEAEFKATGDAEQRLETQTRTLNSQISVQKGIADQARQALEKMKKNGVDESNSAYQKLYTQMMNAQAGANEAQAALNALGDNAQKAAGGAERLSGSLQGISKKISLEQVVSGINSITSGLENAAKKAARLGKAVATEVLGAGTWADELKTTAQAYGISTDELQRMQKTADIIDTDVDAILSARQRLAKNNGSIEELLGFSAEGMSIEDAFWRAGEAIMGMSGAMEQEEAAQKLFGKSWRELVPLFAAGREEYERINGTWKTVSDEQLDSLSEMDDKYQTLKNDLETLKMETLSQLAEPMGALMNSLSELLSSDEGQAAISSVIGAVKTGFEWIADNKEAVVTAITAIGAAFGTLKVSSTVLEFVKLASGLKGLFGGAAAGGSLAGGAGTAAGGGFLKSLFTGGVELSALIPAGVLTAAIAPAMIAQNESRQKWEADYQRRTSAATGGSVNDDFIRRAAEALGTDGQVNFGVAESLLMGLADRQNQQKAELYNLLKGSTTAGNDTWNLLNSFWSGAELDPSTINEMLQNITDAFSENAEKAKVPVDVQVPEDAAAQLSNQIGTVLIDGKIVIGGEDGSHANGIWSVPFDGYLARLHKGERVVPAREVQSRSFSSNLYVENMNMSGGIDAAGLAASIAAAQRRQMSGYGS